MVLKSMAFEQVIEHPRVRLVQEGHRTILSQLLVGLDSAMSNRSVLPTMLGELWEAAEQDEDWSDASGEDQRQRALLDYVAWLTEPQAISLAETLTGRRLDFAATSWLR